MPPLRTQIVGSYVKPAWLVRHGHEHHHNGSWWRPEADVLQQAQDDVVLLAIHEQERAGLDVVTDGEIRRQHYDRHFVSGIGGISLEKVQDKEFQSELKSKTARTDLGDLWQNFRMSPTITGPLEWVSSPAIDELRFVKKHARRPVKAPIVGPMTLYDRLADDYYQRPEDAIMALAGVLNRELKELQAEGTDLLMVADPALHFKLSRSREIGKPVIERLLEGITTPVVLHVCYGYAKYSSSKTINPSYPEVLRLLSETSVQAMSIEYEQPGHTPDLLKQAGDKHVHLGLIGMGSHEIETPEHIAGRLREALKIVPPERLHPSTDCGMWFLPRDVARAKIEALVKGTNIVRRELGLDIPDHAIR
ncbi:hypothetical protein [Rhizobium sp. AN80A]|uniref:hypothetical protein n=1 Tax=Rhizobium sp. AN80A TaxID=3040673 RepID=UPI0024B39795|nr:hypothetical protein [Rhizobium sp. AN80A]